jgi:hypothetical protein
MNATFGGVSAGGMGSPLFEVTQSGAGPCAFVASHPTGNAGGVTSSKFSADVTRGKHDGHLPQPCASRGPSAAPAAMSNTTQRTFHNRFGVNACFTFLIIASGVQPTLLSKLVEPFQFPGTTSSLGAVQRIILGGQRW